MATAISTKKTGRFNLPTETLSVPANRLEEAMQWIQKNQEVSPQIALAVNATIWLLQVDAFRQVEEEALINNKYEETLDEHRAVLSMIIANGEGIIFAAKRVGIAPANFTLPDLESTLNSLHRTFRGEHGPKNSKTTDTLIKQLLDGSQSKD